MSFKPITAKLRKDPLGFSTANQLLRNSRANEDILLVEHTPDGLHNSLEVARGVALVRYSAGSYSIHGSSSASITGVSSPGAGTVTLTLAANKFSTPMAIRLMAMDPSGDSHPWLLNYEVVSATSVKIYLFKHSATDTWTATNGTFAVAIHSAPYYSSATALTHPAELPRGANLSPDEWNALVENQDLLRARQLEEHLAGGTHNAKEISIGFGGLQDVGDGQTEIARENVDSMSAGGTIALTASTFTAPFPVFASAWVKTPNTIVHESTTRLIVCAPEDELTDTAVQLYAYDYDGAAWTGPLSNFSFWVLVHKGA